MLRPGDVVVLPSSAGLADKHGWNPDATEPVPDVSPFVSKTLVLHADLLRNLSDDPPPALLSALTTFLEVDEDTDKPIDQSPAAAEHLFQHLRYLQIHADLQSEWDDLIQELDPRVVNEPGLYPHFSSPRSPQHWIDVAAEAFDELAFDATSVGLFKHGGSVGQLAGRVSIMLGIDEGLVHVLERAGQLHDIGKQDERFQRWLDPHGNHLDEHIAKSSYNPSHSEAHRVAAGWPRGGRHETLSLRAARELVDRNAQTVDDDLLLHLVVSHHGHGRPGVPVADDPTAPKQLIEIGDHSVQINADLAQCDWDQPGRFRSLCDRYGYWGLALLETIVRKADHAASSQSRRGK